MDKYIEDILGFVPWMVYLLVAYFNLVLTYLINKGYCYFIELTFFLLGMAVVFLYINIYVTGSAKPSNFEKRSK